MERKSHMAAIKGGIFCGLHLCHFIHWEWGSHLFSHRTGVVGLISLKTSPLSQLKMWNWTYKRYKHKSGGNIVGSLPICQKGVCVCRHLSYSTSLARSGAGHTSAISLSPTRCHNIINSRDNRVNSWKKKRQNPDKEILHEVLLRQDGYDVF